MKCEAGAFVVMLSLSAGVANAQPSAYIATWGDSPAGSSRIAAVSLPGLTATYIDVGPMPFGVAIHPTLPRVYVSHYWDPSLSVIDASTNTLAATIDVSACPGQGTPTGVAVSPDGTKAYAGGNGGGIFVVDTATNALAACIPLTQYVTGVAVSPDGSRLYAAGYSLLFSVDLASGSYSTAPLPFSLYFRPLVASPDGQTLYVPGRPTGAGPTSDQAGEILMFWTSGLVPLGAVLVPKGPTGLALTHDGGMLYVTNVDPPASLTEINTQTFSTRRAGLIGAFEGGLWRSMDVPVGVDVSVDGSRVYIVSATPHYAGPDGDLFIVDATSLTGISRVVVDNPRDTLGQFVTRNSPPAANAGPDEMLECTGPDGATFVLDASASTDPDGDALTYVWMGPFGIREGRIIEVTLPLGVSTVSVTVTDTGGLSSTATVAMTMRDATPPALTVAITPAVLWSSNHNLVSVTANVAAYDVCDPAPRLMLVSATSSEPEDGLGDGDTASDIQDVEVGTADTTLLLRAERSAHGAGRTYTVTYSATDQSGNATTAAATVFVPKDQGP